ncbi:hypothetical protein [Aeromonas veronii]|uniref:hypothetical protein n=1 Tax=Aeromonas veronii TaxID=654 RepID=UPI0011B1E14C|nr:hypothetical protein [Aeromonas veronii]
MTESAEQIIGQRPGLHFTLPIMPMHDGSDELITTLSAENRAAGVRFPFHDTDNVVASGHQDEDRQGACWLNFHFTLPIPPMHDGSDELITPVVS